MQMSSVAYLLIVEVNLRCTCRYIHVHVIDITHDKTIVKKIILRDDRP